MRCRSCGANIPPEWVMAIQKNECPGCGGEIMDDKSQELLKELSEAMEKMPNDPQGVAGWLISNYRFQKMGTGEPVEKFHRKGSGAGAFDEGNMKVDPTYDQFMKNSDGAKIAARSNELAEKFKNTKFAEMGAIVAQTEDPYGDGTNEVDTSPTDEDEQKAYLELKKAGFDPFGGGGSVSSSKDMSDLSQAINPGDIANLMNNQESPLPEEEALSQTDEGRRYLQRDRFKKLRSQDAVSGGGGGVFRR